VREELKGLDYAFNPKSIAVIGDSRKQNFMWLRALKTFQGRLYSVQVNPGETPHIEEMGVPNYKSILEIPDEVDYAFLSVPRAVAPLVIEECIRKGVKAVGLFTAGFAETGEEEGIRLQREIEELARRSGLKVVGPNCMGIFNPRIGMRQHMYQYHGEGGPVAFIAQSGTHAIGFSLLGRLHGFKISKSVSFGNGAVVDAPDYLEYLAEDPDTHIIAMYLEGVRDGARLLRLVRAITPRKPVVIWKGGTTDVGARAARSHTAALASSPKIWEAFVRQSGAIPVGSMEELVDVVMGLLYIKPPAGDRVGLMAMSGGQSVVITDTFGREGLQVPLLSERSYQQFKEFYSVIGGSYLNPLDMTPNVRGGSLEPIQRVLEILATEENVDSLVFEFNLQMMWRLEAHKERLIEVLAEYKERVEKALLTIITALHWEKEGQELRDKLLQRGLATYPTFARGARALARVLGYYRYIREAATYEATKSIP
jgi:acyl-CoA synthetase (NDP forming)